LPSTMFTRQAYQWINRVNQKFNALAALNLSQEKKQLLKQWLEEEFVFFTLLLEDSRIERQLIRQIIQGSPIVEQSEEYGKARDLLYRLRIVENFVEGRGAKARLNIELLLSLDPGGEFRKTDTGAGTAGAEHLPMIVENACRWFAMESFAELNPVEQAAIALLRMLEIAPFEHNNQRSALIAASLFTLRSALPPIIFKPAQRQTYFAAIKEGLRMNTQPMVELVGEAIEQTLDESMQVINTDK
jgi:hypothetical protein